MNPDRVRRGTLALGARAGTSVEAMLLAATDEFDEDEDEEAELLQSLKDGVAFGAEDPDTPRFVSAVGTVQKMNAGIAAFQTGRPSTPPAMQTISEAADPPGAAQPTQQHEAGSLKRRAQAYNSRTNSRNDLRKRASPRKSPEKQPRTRQYSAESTGVPAQRIQL